MDFEKENNGFDWKKDDPLRPDFDFDDFLREDSLDDRITAAVDGKDLLEPDALGVAPGYVPRRPGDGEHGRHEAPEPEAESDPAPASFDPRDPRYAAPERPRVVVTQPRRSVYVTPPGGDDDGGGDRNPPSGGSGALKWVIAILIALIVIGAVLLAVAALRSGGRGRDTEPDDTRVSDAAPTSTPARETEKPAETSAPTDAPRAKHMITVTAGSGGSVSPSGVVSVEDGEDVSFSIRPNDGYTLTQVLVDGNAVSLSDSYTFRSVTGDHTIYAVFEKTATPTPPPPAQTPEPTPAPTPEPTPVPTPAPTDPPPAIPDTPGEGGEEEVPPGGWDVN